MLFAITHCGVFVVRSCLSLHACIQVCHQHELVDGTRISGFKPKRLNLSLQRWGEWSNWRPASARYGARNGYPLGHLLPMCQRCWLKRRGSQVMSNTKKKVKRSKAQVDLKYHTPRHSEAGQTADEDQKVIDNLIKYCAVHRTADEKKLWECFSVLKQELATMGDQQAHKEHKACRIRELLAKIISQAVSARCYTNSGPAANALAIGFDTHTHRTNVYHTSHKCIHAHLHRSSYTNAHKTRLLGAA